MCILRKIKSEIGGIPQKINQELQNIHRITNGKVQYQSQDTRRFSRGEKDFPIFFTSEKDFPIFLLFT